jgi:5'-nucleotidase
MKYGCAWALAAILMLSAGMVGCSEKKTAGEPPVQLGLGPGETAPYQETTPATAETATPATPTEVVTPVAGTPPAKATTKSAATAVPKTYKIQKGDTLYGLARRFYNDPNKWKDIQNANRDKITDPNRLKVGTEIRLP